MNYLTTTRISWLDRLIQRFHWAMLAFKAPAYDPHIRLKNGVLVDLVNRRIVIPGDFNIHTEGNLKLSADKHVLITSGQDAEERPGYVHGIWFNAAEDQFGRPLLEDEKLIEHVEEEHCHGCT